MVDVYFARRPFGYGRYGHLDRGRVVELLGAANDEKLTRLGYLEKYDPKAPTSDCGECGERYIGDAERAAHGRERHTPRDLTPLEEDQRQERQERMLDQVAPLYLDKTAATTGQVATEIRTEAPSPVQQGQQEPPKKRRVGALRRS